MNLYLLTQNENNYYDTYDSCVVAAENENEARLIHPDNPVIRWNGKRREYGSWCDAKDVKVKLIGEAIEDTAKGVVLASYNAG